MKSNSNQNEQEILQAIVEICESALCLSRDSTDPDMMALMRCTLFAIKAMAEKKLAPQEGK
jgi:hypothetical protein